MLYNLHLEKENYLIEDVFDSDGTIYYTGFSYGRGGRKINNRYIYRRNKKKKTSKRKRKITKRKKKSLKKTKRR